MKRKFLVTCVTSNMPLIAPAGLQFEVTHTPQNDNPEGKFLTGAGVTLGLQLNYYLYPDALLAGQGRAVAPAIDATFNYREITQ